MSGLSGEAWDPWDGPIAKREPSTRCGFVAPNGLPCTSRWPSHPRGSHSTSDGRGWPMEPVRDLSMNVVAISAMIDGSYPRHLDPEAHRWRRCAKISEECGEVTEALLGLAGENPRKGVTHEMADVRKELLDVALAALGAVAHLDGNSGDPIGALTKHAQFVADRLRAALAAQPTTTEAS